eukprot:9360983-Alexandrium_andersonii.AAC.1
MRATRYPNSPFLWRFGPASSTARRVGTWMWPSEFRNDVQRRRGATPRGRRGWATTLRRPKT